MILGRVEFGNGRKEEDRKENMEAKKSDNLGYSGVSGSVYRAALFTVLLRQQ